MFWVVIFDSADIRGIEYLGLTQHINVDTYLTFKGFLSFKAVMRDDKCYLSQAN